MQRTTSGAAGNGLNTTIKTSSTCVCKPTVESCVDTTAKLRPQASVLALRAAGANQLLRPASTTPRSYGRRHRSWHHGHVHATHNERRCGKRPVHHDQDIKYMRGTSGIGMGTTIKHLRCTTSGAAGNGQGATMTYLRRTTSAAANNCMQRLLN